MLTLHRRERHRLVGVSHLPASLGCALDASATPIKRKSENLIMDSINFEELKSLVFVPIKFNVFSSGTKCRSARNTCCIVSQRQPRFSFKYCCGCSDNVPATSERCAAHRSDRFRWKADRTPLRYLRLADMVFRLR